MARVTLTHDECLPRGLPLVCMACGRPAEVARSKTFTWRTPEVSMLWLVGLGTCLLGSCFISGVLVILAVLIFLLPFALTKRCEVYTPLCPDHASYWVVRAWLQLGGALALVCSLVGTLVFANRLSGPRGHWGEYSLVAWLIAALAWLIATTVLSQTSIRPCGMVDAVELLGVHADFAAALARQRAASDSAGKN